MGEPLSNVKRKEKTSTLVRKIKRSAWKETDGRSDERITRRVSHNVGKPEDLMSSVRKTRIKPTRQLDSLFESAPKDDRIEPRDTEDTPKIKPTEVRVKGKRLDDLFGGESSSSGRQDTLAGDDDRKPVSTVSNKAKEPIARSIASSSTGTTNRESIDATGKVTMSKLNQCYRASNQAMELNGTGTTEKRKELSALYQAASTRCREGANYEDPDITAFMTKVSEITGRQLTVPSRPETTVLTVASSGRVKKSISSKPIKPDDSSDQDDNISFDDEDSKETSREMSFQTKVKRQQASASNMPTRATSTKGVSGVVKIEYGDNDNVNYRKLLDTIDKLSNKVETLESELNRFKSTFNSWKLKRARAPSPIVKSANEDSDDNNDIGSHHDSDDDVRGRGKPSYKLNVPRASSRSQTTTQSMKARTDRNKNRIKSELFNTDATTRSTINGGSASSSRTVTPRSHTAEPINPITGTVVYDDDDEDVTEIKKYIDDTEDPHDDKLPF
ncbi:hypothetical protein HDU85_005931 [Gaertneriomyces sp. JEL0708]|nr:hypothetical protein HDU85_005931 [Gaertneriomyces sp. JEL0708]